MNEVYMNSKVYKKFLSSSKSPLNVLQCLVNVKVYLNEVNLITLKDQIYNCNILKNSYHRVIFGNLGVL